MGRRSGFSLVELLVAMALLAVMVVLLGSVFSSISFAWGANRGKADQFLAGRLVIESITDRVQMATLSARNDFVFQSSHPHVPEAIGRKSDYFFQIGRGLALEPPLASRGQAILFYAPVGEIESPELLPYSSLLNLCGFFVTFGPGPDEEEAVLPRNRFRLWELVVPSERLDRVATGGNVGPANDWQDFDPSQYARVVAENIPLCLYIPIWESKDEGAREGVTNGLVFDSRLSGHLLPQKLRIILLVISEVSALELEESGMVDSIVPPNLFSSFHSPDLIDRDLQALRSHLDQWSGGIEYRIFESVVPLPVADLR